MNMFSADRFFATRRPLSEASPLPADCYTSPEWYQREVETIFLKEWLMVGRTEQIAEPGDYIVENIVGEAVVVIRGQDGEVRAFSPFCRHRGTRLFADGDKGNCKLIVCPYHAWTYHLDGTLRGAPDMDQVKNFAKGDFALRRIRCEIWEGFVFINFDDAAQPFQPTLGSLPERLAKYRLSDLVLARQKSYIVNANWKFYVDNSIEPYHVPIVHGGTIQYVGPKSTWRFEPNDGKYMMLYGLFPGSLALLQGDIGFPAIEGMTLDREERHDLPWILPNTHFLGTVDTLWWLTMFPEGPDKTRVTVNSAFHGHLFDRPDFERLAESYYRRLDATNVEDNGIVERQQQGARLRKYIPGRFSLWERNAHLFANFILDRVVGGDYFALHSQSVD